MWEGRAYGTPGRDESPVLAPGLHCYCRKPGPEGHHPAARACGGYPEARVQPLLTEWDKSNEGSFCAPSVVTGLSREEEVGRAQQPPPAPSLLPGVPAHRSRRFSAVQMRTVQSRLAQAYSLSVGQQHSPAGWAGVRN